MAFALAALVAAFFAAVLSPIMVAAGLMDSPNCERKSHGRPTATSGGLMIAAGYALGLACACYAPLAPDLNGAETLAMASVSLGAFAALGLGFIDDIHALNAPPKGVAIVAVCIGVAFFAGPVEALSLYGPVVLRLGLVAGVAGSALWIFVLANATNFMDGADGLAMGSTAISLAALAVLSALCHAPAAALMAGAGAGGLVGFLIWNWPKARLFAGDSGALFAGVLGAATALVAIREGGVSTFVMPVLFFPTLADALLTLAWRVARRRRVFNGHREHVYQIGLRAGLKPVHVTLCYWLATFGCAAAGVGAALFQRYAYPPPGADFLGLAHAVAAFATVAPKILFICAALFALWLVRRVRMFSIASGLDGSDV